MGNSLLDIILNTDYRNKGVEAAKSGLKSLSGGVNDVASSMGIFNLRGVTTAAVVAGIAGAVKKAVGDYIEYGDQVRETTNLTGLHAEEASRLIQVTDDMGIEYSTLKTILTGANKQGFEPTIDNLAKLADEFNNETDLIKKNKIVTDALGKSGLAYIDVLKLGGDAIREKAAAVEEGMLLDEAALAAQLEFKQSVDGLEDAMAALGNALAEEVIPELEKWIDFIKQGIDAGIRLKNWNQDLTGVLQEHEQVVLKTAGSYDEYIKEMVRAGLQAGTFEGAEVNLAKAFMDGTLEAEKQDAVLFMLANSMGASTEATFENDQALANWEGALDGAELKAIAFKGVVGDVGGAMQDMLTPIDLAKNSMGELTAQMLYNQAAAGLDADASLRLAQQMGLVDQGTYAAMNALNSLRADLNEGKITLDEYNAKVVALGNAWSLIPEHYETSYDINVNVQGDPVPDFGINDPDAPLPTEDEVVINGMQASGGPVKQGGAYWVGEEGPEFFRASNGGYIWPNESAASAAGGGGVVINTGPVTVRSDADIELVAQRLAELIARRR